MIKKILEQGGNLNPKVNTNTTNNIDKFLIPVSDSKKNKEKMMRRQQSAIKNVNCEL